MEGVEEKYGISTLGIYKITSDDYNPTVLPGGGDGIITSQNQLKTVADFQMKTEKQEKKRKLVDDSAVLHGVGTTNVGQANTHSSLWCWYCPSTSWSPPTSGDGDCCDCDCCDCDCGCCDCGSGDCDCGGLDCGGCDCGGC